MAGIGYILYNFPVLSETYILNEILALEARGTTVHIFSLKRPEDPQHHEGVVKLNASVTYLPRLSNLRWAWSYQVRAARQFRRSYFEALAAAARSGQPDVWWRFLQSTYIATHVRRLGLGHLHSHYANHPTTVAYFTNWITGIPYSFTAHAWDIFKTPNTKPRSVKALSRKIARAEFVVGISEFHKAYLQRIAAESRSKIVRLYPGIDLERFGPNEPVQGQPFTLLAVCRLVEKKGMAILIEACRHLRRRDVAFQTWIVGAGRLRAQLEAQIKDSGLQPHVRLLGPHTQLEVLARYHLAHLFVLPCVVGPDGDRDGLPIAIVEALACGLPIVTTPVTGIPEVVRHRHNGLLVPEADACGLADAIEAVIRDPALYHRMRANARPSVQSAFDLRRTAATLARWFNL